MRQFFYNRVGRGFPGEKRFSCLTGCGLLLLLGVCGGAAGGPSPQIAAPAALERVAEEIRTAASAGSRSAHGHPLPLAAHWEAGWPGDDQGDGFDPSYQLDEIERGQYLLPWFRLPEPGQRYDPGYFEQTIARLASLRLPISFVSLQWERVAAFAKQDASGRWVPANPFGPVDEWYAAGRRWGEHPALKRLAALYPNPPLVLFVSNNEYPRPALHELLNSPEVLARVGAGASESAQRAAIASAWIERYAALLRGFRDGLPSDEWRAHARFVGFDAFPDSAIGRWSGWADDSFQLPGWREPWPQVWDGASAPYATHDWQDIADYTVWSPQIEAMNRVPTLDYVQRHRPDYWFEITVWDGQSPGSPTDKLWFYRMRGQQLTPARYAGMVQFGMWLLRPRVVREFRGPGRARAHFGAYFDAVMQAVARVHRDPVLVDFWRSGLLVPNPVGGHPYQEKLPAGFAQSTRWFLLDSPANPPRPWGLKTALEVFALCLERGHRPQREWLVYAFTPLHELVDVPVKIPDGAPVRVRGGLAGCFSLVRERGGSVQSLGC